MKPIAAATMNRRLAGPLSLLALCAAIAGCGGGGGGAGSAAKSNGPVERAPVGGRYVYWPQFPDDPRVQFVRSFRSNEDVSQHQASGFEKLVFGKEAEATDLINKPYGVAMKRGVVYVCDIRNDCLMALDLVKRQSRIIGRNGSSTLKQPVAVCVADDGEIFVADNAQGTIFVYDASERFSRVFGHPKFKPAGVAVFGDRVYVTNTTSQTVEIFDRKSGDQVGTIGSVGDQDGQFRLPLGIATDSKGNIWVADMMRCRMQKFAPDGKLLTAFGSLGDYRGSFARPKHIAVDADDVLYVVDAAFQNVQMFDAQNRPLMHFGSGGDFPGAMNLPAGVCVSDDSLGAVADQLHPGFAGKRVVVVTNQFGAEKVAVYAMGQLKSGYTAKDLAANAAKIDAGVDTTPSKERLRLQTPGDQEPNAETGGGEPPAAGAAPAAPASPEPKPAAAPK